MTYEELLIRADEENLIVKEKDIPGYGGRIYKNRVAIHKNIPTAAEKACILAEELGHYHTTVGDILDQTRIENKKQELKARIWAYNNQIGLSGVLQAYKHHCQDLYEMAEYLEVTEEFLKEALNHYRKKYGECTAVDNYIVYFEPSLGVMELK